MCECLYWMVLSDSVSLCQADTESDNWKRCHTNSSFLENSYHALDERCPLKLCPCLRAEKKIQAKFTSLVLLSEGVLLSLHALTQLEVSFWIVLSFLLPPGYNRSQSKIKGKITSKPKTKNRSCNCTEEQRRSTHSKCPSCLLTPYRLIHSSWQSKMPNKTLKSLGTPPHF